MSDQRWNRLKQRAYEIWERQGQPEGRAAGHWQEAERSLQAEGEDQAVSAPAPGPGQLWKGRSTRADSAEQQATLVAAARSVDSNGQPLPPFKPGAPAISVKLRQAVRRQPLQAVSIALGAGVLLGWILRGEVSLRRYVAFNRLGS